jgi:hypothetical protein
VQFIITSYDFFEAARWAAKADLSLRDWAWKKSPDGLALRTFELISEHRNLELMDS